MFLETQITNASSPAEPTQGKKPPFFDTQEKLDTLIRLYHAGWGMRDIGIELGTNKNTVLGKINRLRQLGTLGGRPAPKQNSRVPGWWSDDRLDTLRQCNADGMTAKETASALRCRTLRVVRKAHVLGLTWQTVIVPTIAPRPSPYASPALTGEPPSLNVPLIDAEPLDCRWPTTQATCCGHPAVTQPRRRPYCEYHCGVSYKAEPSLNNPQPTATDAE